MPSPRPGFSTLTTSAPRSPSSDVHHGPAAWRAVAADPEIRCALLTGAGERAFCAGMDMKTTIPAAQRFARGERIEPEVFEGLRSVATALLAGFDLATPLVCAVNGHARAGGSDLMLAAELRYAVPEATFAL